LGWRKAPKNAQVYFGPVQSANPSALGLRFDGLLVTTCSSVDSARIGVLDSHGLLRGGKQNGSRQVSVAIRTI